ncbi:hypothetical protein RJ639_021286 [Escallonia herrerae]|uniref:PAP-specific phosphatase, mitochondrial n=1 Tax=Escallonia herrerae TaxID=1293975 RepID=A0AA88V6Y1_9ASTE|nr:hypothetical protein RJ639_021286 [Escallonia herrerae]
MDILHHSASRLPSIHFLRHHRRRPFTTSHPRCFTVRSPPVAFFPPSLKSRVPLMMTFISNLAVSGQASRSRSTKPSTTKSYKRPLTSSRDLAAFALTLSVYSNPQVKKSLFSSDGRILEKNDQTPVTVADFGVQALVSLELGKLFPSIPLVAEEDSAFLRSNNLANSVLNVVSDKARFRDIPLTQDHVLEAIDRGGKDAFVFGCEPATYWILDPIDGTRGFLKGSEALYVVGLALVVAGEIVLGVMGCPNWVEEGSSQSTTEFLEYDNTSGTIMVAHVGCGTWRKRLLDILNSSASRPNDWTRCLVNACHLVHEARFCISDSQTWESLPLSCLFDSTTSVETAGNNQVFLLPICCGSLCKYLMVASGRASIFILRARAERVIKVWDHAVGVICVHEAGGEVTDWEGSQLDIAVDQSERRVIFPSGGILVTNSSLHTQIIGIISSSSSVA